MEQKLDLTAFFSTKEQANDFMTRIGTISGQIYQTTFNLEQALSQHFGLRKKDLLLALFRDNSVDIAKAASIKEFLTKIQQTVTSLPIITLTVAFEPTEKTLQVFSEWFLINTKKQFIFDISVDPTIIGGCSISTKGKFMNFSIKPEVDKIIQTLITQAIKTQPIQEANEQPKHQSLEHLHLGR